MCRHVLTFHAQPPPVIRPQAALNDRETLETEVRPVLTTRYSGRFSLLSAMLLIHSYFNIVKREMIDTVPKAISLTLINHSKEDLQREFKPDVLEDLLMESELVVACRKEVVSMVRVLNKP